MKQPDPPRRSRGTLDGDPPYRAPQTSASTLHRRSPDSSASRRPIHLHWPLAMHSAAGKDPVAASRRRSPRPWYAARGWWSRSRANGSAGGGAPCGDHPGGHPPHSSVSTPAAGQRAARRLRRPQPRALRSRPNLCRAPVPSLTRECASTQTCAVARACAARACASCVSTPTGRPRCRVGRARTARSGTSRASVPPEHQRDATAIGRPTESWTATRREGWTGAHSAACSGLAFHVKQQLCTAAARRASSASTANRDGTGTDRPRRVRYAKNPAALARRCHAARRARTRPLA